jgi:hypothetical protein
MRGEGKADPWRYCCIRMRGRLAAASQYARPVILLLSGLFMSATVVAQGANEKPEAESGSVDTDSSAASQVMDEITVIAPKSVMAISADIRRADQMLYGIFNEMNTDREFDVHCRLEKVYASNRKARVCLPAFEYGVLEESWNDLSTWTDAVRPAAEIRRNREIFKQKMIDFAEQNPELKKAIYERAQLQRDLREAEARTRAEE